MKYRSPYKHSPAVHSHVKRYKFSNIHGEAGRVLGSVLSEEVISPMCVNNVWRLLTNRVHDNAYIIAIT